MKSRRWQLVESEYCHTQWASLKSLLGGNNVGYQHCFCNICNVSPIGMSCFLLVAVGNSPTGSIGIKTIRLEKVMLE